MFNPPPCTDLSQMERIHQMNVVPDILPSIHPSFDLRLTFPEPPPESKYLRNRTKRQHKQVEPGVFLVSEQVGLREKYMLPFLGRSLTSCIDPKTTNALCQCLPRGNQTL